MALTHTPLRIAMWSGPRNISTALMRSWGNRPDTTVCDEPLYAHYLVETGLDHPGRDEVIASQETDWRKVADWLTGPIPQGKSIFYQKHMAHHLLPDVGRGWLAGLTHVFLIRDPREMLTSLLKVTPAAGFGDTGLAEQWELFGRARDETGRTPAVIDARDVLENPRGVLAKLCECLGVAFMEEMLGWAPGPRDTDGVWAPHWYAAVEKSSGFGPYTAKDDEVPASHAAVLAECKTYYHRLHRHRLEP